MSYCSCLSYSSDFHLAAAIEYTLLQSIRVSGSKVGCSHRSHLGGRSNLLLNHQEKMVREAETNDFQSLRSPHRHCDTVAILHCASAWASLGCSSSSGCSHNHAFLSNLFRFDLDLKERGKSMLSCLKSSLSLIALCCVRPENVFCRFDPKHKCAFVK